VQDQAGRLACLTRAYTVRHERRSAKRTYTRGRGHKRGDQASLQYQDAPTSHAEPIVVLRADRLASKRY
jgi:hypothetical protein